jgi:peptidoglycan/xylan/chitin deacetylase (PgdA/CDA1 family)
MSGQHTCFSRRAALQGAAGWAAGLGVSTLARAAASSQAAPGAARQNDSQALVAITCDIEMGRHYPTWDDWHWDYEKGNLDIPTKNYCVEAARRVKARGGVIHFFYLGRSLEQEDVSWLRQIHETGHPIGNHTYDHVNIKATKPDQVQYRFTRAPWLMGGKQPAEVIRDNIRLASAALKERLGFEPDGFRSPYGFANGLTDRPDVQQMLLDLGFRWVSTMAPSAKSMEGNLLEFSKKASEGVKPSPAIYEEIRNAQVRAQPFIYPSGLVEIPMNPVSDVQTMRNFRWKLDDYLKNVRIGLEWAIENGKVYDFLCHPSCMQVNDPNFRAVELVCDMVEKSNGRAKIVNLRTIAAWAKQNAKKET